MDFSAIDKYIDDNAGRLIGSLSRLIAVPSKRSAAAEGKPFGESCAKALELMEEMAAGAGLKTENLQNYMLECDYNGEETALGIIAHLDVVPEGDGWETDPFELTRKGDALYGRGTIDDKGPAAAVLFAAKALKENGVRLKKNVRLLFGSDEESGMEDLEYYRSKRPLPKMMLSPDGEFPVINVEKGVCQLKFKKSYAEGGGLLSLKAGRVVNAVPDKAEAALRGVSADAVKAAAKRINLAVETASEGENLRISAKGASAHGSTPEKGNNALTGLIEILLSLNLENGELSETVKSLSALFPYGESDGEHMGLKMRDEESGALSALFSLLDAENGALSGGIDIRFPATVKLAEVTEIVKGSLEPLGLELDFFHCMEGHSVPQDSEFVQTLLGCYSAVTGKEGKCIAEGGATYLHTVEGGVAYGAEMPGEENNMHGANEHIRIETLLNVAKIYARAICRLCGTAN